MIVVTSTPLRISLFGGGTDLPQYYEQSRLPGLVISSTINKRINVAINRCESEHIRAVYSKTEVVDDVNNLEHDRIRECLKLYKYTKNLEIYTSSEILSRGTGLGSSSSFTVGLLNALSTLSRSKVDSSNEWKAIIADLACKIEIEDCGDLIGKQDQYAAAFGGWNAFSFHRNRVSVEPLSNVNYKCLESNLVCFYTNTTRDTNSSAILKDQASGLLVDSEIFKYTNELRGIAQEFYYQMTRPLLLNFDFVGALLHQSWLIKKKLSKNISNPEIDVMYERARHLGACGGKLLGAGGGGCMLFYVPDDNKFSFIFEMKKHYKQFVFNFENKGTTAAIIE
jgi:D-glycero-alpha-D-manno-heptose-7-phosphate kinase